jgi:hypothetical protein
MAASDRSTAKQLRYLRALAEQTGTTFATPATRREASQAIEQLRQRPEPAAGRASPPTRAGQRRPRRQQARLCDGPGRDRRLRLARALAMRELAISDVQQLQAMIPDRAQHPSQPASAFRYVNCTVPIGMTLTDYRRRRQHRAPWWRRFWRRRR